LYTRRPHPSGFPKKQDDKVVRIREEMREEEDD
jgi:hypothetical protein